MARAKHVIRNSTDKPQFVNFELSTQRFRLNPGDELSFYYETEFARSDEPPLITDYVEGVHGTEIVIWTNFGSEEGPFLPNGEEAITNWD
jgi:hypothetical protein